MNILISLTYFTPNKSGLTVYVERLAQGLAKKGHSVTVLTSKHLSDLPKEETCENVRIVRLPILCKISKGVIIPSLIWKAHKLIRNAEVVNVHLPQLEAFFLTILAKLAKKKVVATYHSDLIMPSGWMHYLAGFFARLSITITARLADVIVHNTYDFAENSPILSKYLKKIRIIPPPIEVENVTAEQIQDYRQKYKIKPDDIVIGMAARLATEKGVEYLVQAMEIVLKHKPQARVIFAGEYEHVIGEEAYKQKVLALIQKTRIPWIFTGVDSQTERAAFYHVCDVLVLPSINRTETFGMVQVEALFCGTPVVASDLPGVRQPVIQSGLGEIVNPCDSAALADAILRTIERYPEKILMHHYTDQFQTEIVTQKYETLFEELL